MSTGSPQVEAAYPLSPVQQGMLFHSVFAPESGVYVTQVSRELQDVDVEAFREAWQRAVDRHAILRTAFVWKKTEEPLQLVGRRVRLPIQVEDWRDLGEAERERRLVDHLRSDRERGFEPSRAPLMRLALFRLGDRRYRLVWSHHHLILDGWSVPLLLGEVMTSYRALASGHEPALAAPRPYSDYIEWLERQDRSAAEDYWRRTLAGYSGQGRLPFVRPPAGDGVPAAASAEVSVLLEPADTDRLQHLAQSAGVTLNTVLRAAWALCLGRFSGDDDVVFGATVAGRPETLEGAERMVGLFINTLPVRLEIPVDRPLAAWLPEVQDRQAEMTAHGHLALARIRKLVDLPVGGRLFDTLLVFENYPSLGGPGGSEGRDGEADGAPRLLSFEATNYPLSLLVGPGRRLTLRLLYDSAWVGEDEGRRLLHHLAALLADMGRRPEAPLRGLDLFDRAARHQVLVEWASPAALSRGAPAVHRSVADHASRTPDRVAVVHQGYHLSYGELMARARRLAGRLAAAGADREQPVAVCLPRGPDLVVAALGTVLSGAAYLPIDPAYPAERLRFLVEDSATRVVVVEDGPLEGLGALGLTWLKPEGRSRPGAEEAAPEPPPDRLEPEHPIYFIYTSGSTGSPKAVTVTHRNVARLFSSLQPRFGFGPDDTWTLFHSFAFDFSVWEMWGALAFGGRLVVVPYLSSRDPDEHRRLLARERVTVLNQTPSAFRQLVTADRTAPRDLALRWVVFGGEALEPASVAAWFEAHGDAIPELVNMYGITETTVHVTHATVRRDDVRPGTMPSIGRAIADLYVRLLDPWSGPVPVGAAAELHVGGAGLARGYLGRPKLTGERFVPDPFAGPDRPGARLYRSGDLGRLGPDGRIEYLGRLDHQVKVRGFRVELGEIEAALASCPGVREASVLLREDTPGDRRLVAYVVAASDLAPAAVRNHLVERLPDHMVPASVVPLPAFPLTVNGKLDRRALPAPDPGATIDSEGAVLPRTPTEAQLAEIWSEVLRIERIGVLDNFFELGGDSILCLQVVARANRRGIHLTPRQLFQNPTVAGLAAVAEEAPTVTRDQETVTGATPLTPIQAAFFEDLVPAPERYNQSMLFELTEAPDAGAFARAVRQVEEHHDGLRLRFHRTPGQGWSQTCAAPGDRVPFSHVDLRRLRGPRLVGVVEELAARLQGSLDLSRGPLVRVALFDAGGGEPARLLLVVHHLVVDGVSWRILLEDLETAYLAYRERRVPDLPPKTTSFRAWAHRLRERAASPETAAELDYWTGALGAGVAPLPVDRHEGPDDQRSAATVTESLSPEDTEALVREVPAAYGTRIDEVLLAGLVLGLTAWTGESACLVELEGHGREDPSDRVDLSRTVGWFTTLFPVCIRVPEATPAEALRAAKETLRAVPGRGVGYGLLRHLHPEPSVRARLAAQGRPQIVFNYLGQIDPPRGGSDWVRPARERVRGTVSPDGKRPYLILVSGVVRAGRLDLAVTFSENRHRRKTMEQLAAGVASGLRAIVAHCRAAGAGGLTPSDFPDVDLSQRELDDLVAQLDG